MNKILHIASTFKSHESDDGGVMIRGMASTDHSDRVGDVIKAEAWSKGGLDQFKNNPIILFNHDYDRPIGRATGVKVTDNGLELEAKISKAAPANVAQLVKDGVLGAFSVGFKVKDADYNEETDGLRLRMLSCLKYRLFRYLAIKQLLFRSRNHLTLLMSTMNSRKLSPIVSI